MEWVETTGRTIAEALDAALDELGVDEEDVEYEVLEEPKSGFLGRLGSSEGRIRARVKPISREKPGERQRRNRRGSSRPKGGGSGNGSGGGGNGSRQRSGSGSSEGGASGSSDRGSSEGAGSSSGRRRRGGSGGGNGGSRGQSGNARQDQKQESNVDTIESDVPIEEQAAAAERFTQGLVDAFDLGAQAKSVIDDEVVVVDVTGDNLGLLVGPKGATLHAIEELVRTVVQRQTDGHGVRIHVDVAGYRAKRRAALADFTTNLAEKVLETGKAQALEPMSASDRKVVHDTAAEIDGITTISEGEDPRRRVGLLPPLSPAPGLIDCCARPPRTVEMSDRDPGALPDILEDARELGLLGPGPVARQLEHALDLATAIGEFEGRMLDLGSGGGLPGLVLFDRWQGATGVLLDAQHRRCEFLTRAVTTLDLGSRVVVECGRAEMLARSEQLRAAFDLVVARSFGAPAVTAECAVGFLRAGGELVVTEPPDSDPEERWPVVGLAELGFEAAVPMRVGETGAVRMRLTGVPDDRWPRRDGVPTKRPLW